MKNNIDWALIILMLVAFGMGVISGLVLAKPSYEPKYGDHVCIVDGFYKGQKATINSKEQFTWFDRYFFTLDGKMFIEFDTLKKSEIIECK